MPARSRRTPPGNGRAAEPRYVHHDPLLPVDPDLAPDDPSEPATGHRPGARVRRSRQPGVLAAIVVGGFLGTLARHEVGLAWPTPAGHVPWATFTINTTGSLALGAILATLLAHPGRLRYLRPLVCVGFLGAWTTMSTFSLEADLLVRHAHVATAVLYVVATVAVGLSATWAGIAIARRANARGASWRSR
jgi:CrcB protein